jgi:glycosyltransferase involved in cell wall biosynthesis
VKVGYLEGKVEGYDLLVACQSVPYIHPALERLDDRRRPPLIEHGGLVSEVFECPKHFTTRYVGVCATIRDAAWSLMPRRPHHALEIPSMVDLSEFDPADRAGVRRELGVPERTPLIGLVGRFERRKRVEDFIRAAAMVSERRPEARFVIIGGPAANMPEYAEELRALARDLALGDVLRFLGERPDVPRLLMGLDALAWVSLGEGMPHVIAEAGAARLPVVATRDNGSEEQITDGVTGLFVPHERPRAVASELERLIS